VDSRNLRILGTLGENLRCFKAESPIEQLLCTRAHSAAKKNRSLLFELFDGFLSRTERLIVLLPTFLKLFSYILYSASTHQQYLPYNSSALINLSVSVSGDGGGGGGEGGEGVDYGHNNSLLNFNMAPPPSSSSSSCSNGKCFDNYTNEYVKDIIDKMTEKEEKEVIKSYLYDNKPSVIDATEYYLGPYETTASDSSHFDQNNNNNSNATNRHDVIDARKTAILSKFYKPDGTPLKGLWDTDVFLKEQRSYKYDPKPLERRKNPRSFVPTDKKTQDYWEKRRKNNVAARKSREDRRKKEIEVLKSVNNLKNDNVKLKLYAQKVMTENQNLKYEIEMLKRL